MPRTTSGPGSQPKMKGRRRRHGVTKSEMHPDQLDFNRRCWHAMFLKYTKGLTWEEVSASPWPVDEHGAPVPGAGRMWTNRSDAYNAVKRYHNKILDSDRELVLKAILSRHMIRHRVLSEGVYRGNLDCISESRLEDVFLAKLFGLDQPAKMQAPMNPDGSLQIGNMTINIVTGVPRLEGPGVEVKLIDGKVTDIAATESSPADD